MVGEKKVGFGTYFYFDHRVKYEGEYSDDSRVGRGYCIYMANKTDWFTYDG